LAQAGEAIDTVSADLGRYIAFGGKASGGAGDDAAGAWLEGELKQSGFVTERLPFTAPFFTPSRAEAVVGNTRAAVIPQAIVVPTPTKGVTGIVRRLQPGLMPAAPLTDAIALIDLPYNRWSSALAKPVQDTVNAALAGGAVAALVITNGPTRKAIALNADGRKPMFSKPVATLAPEDAGPFLSAAEHEQPATLFVTGQAGRRPAFNLVGRLDRGRPRSVVVSTPRSGWFTCAGERGGGVAAWCSLARWAPKALPGYNLIFICNSGHEYEYLGAEHAFESALPKPAETAMWLHLGANVAARDWQELTGTLLPLPSADPQRYLVTSPGLVPMVQRLFASQPGLEVPRATGSFAAGELTNVLAAGYTDVLGIFGAHRFHHTLGDDQSCADQVATARAITALKAILLAISG
jgi:hypothetical protein